MRNLRPAVLALLFLLFLSGFHGAAQSRFIHLAASGDTESTLFDITRRTMELELELAGFSVEPSQAANRENPLYRSTLDFESANHRASFTMRIFDVDTGTKLSEVVREGVPLSLEYDTVVSDAARLLVAEIPHPPRTLEAPAGDIGATKPVLPFGGDNGLELRPKSPEERYRPGDRTEGRSPPHSWEHDRSEGQWAGMFVTLGAAPLLITGTTGDYLKFGALGMATIGYRRRFNAVTGSVAFEGGFAPLWLEQGSPGDDLFLVPLGAALSAEVPGQGRFSLGATGAVGAAVVTLKEGGASFSKAVPYNLVGLQAGLALPPRLILRLESYFLAFYERRHPILGFSPQLTLHWMPRGGSS